MDEPQELIEEFSALANLLLSEETLESVLRHVADTAVKAIPACDSVGVSVAKPEGVTTIAASGELADRLDGLQYATDEGPCLEAIRTGQPVRADDVQREGRWPQFAPKAAGEGLRAVLSLPLVTREVVLGALNLYSRTAPFDPTQERLANLFAVQAAVGLTNMETYQHTKAMVNQLTQALQSRDVIGQAKGVLMARNRCTADEAFDILRRASQRLNMKLRDVAEQIVRSAAEPDEETGR